MRPEIDKIYLFVPTAKDIWEVVQEMYSDAENFSQIFEIKTKLWQERQGERDVTGYYMEMTVLLQELDQSVEDKWDCTGDCIKYKKSWRMSECINFWLG